MINKNITKKHAVLQIKESVVENGWKEEQLQNIVSKLGDGLHGTPEYSEDGEFFFINGNNLNNGNIVIKNDTKRVSLSEYKKHKKILNKNTLLLSINGTIGNVAYYNDEPVILGKSACYFNLIEGVSRRFIRYILSSYSFLHYLESYSTGTTIKNVSLKMMREFNFKLPPLPEQKRIAHILGSLDDKIELNRKMNETIEQMAQTLFKSWFVDFDPVIENAIIAGHPIPEQFAKRAEIRKKIIAEKSPSPTGRSGDEGLSDEFRQLFPNEFELIDELGWIPKGWEVRSVEEVIQVNPRVSLKKGTVASFVEMKALPTSGYSVTDIIEKAYKGGAKFENGDILLARITPCLQNGKTAIVDFLKEGKIGFGSTEFIILRGKCKIKTSFIACLSRLPEFRNHCIQSMVGSSGRQRVQNACFSNYFLALPSGNKLLNKFEDLLYGNFKKIYINSSLSKELSKTRDRLLPKLLSGELNIENIEKEMEV